MNLIQEMDADASDRGPPAGRHSGREPKFHPPGEYLIEFAAGASSAATAALVGSHLALCRKCRGGVDALETIGGILVKDLAAGPLPEDLLARTLDRLDEPVSQNGPKRAENAGLPTGDVLWPAPLQKLLGRSPREIPWSPHGQGVSVFNPIDPALQAQARLYRIKAGLEIPKHGHKSPRLTIVLAGGFRDEAGHYAAGDVIYSDETVVHSLTIDADRDCLCLRVEGGQFVR
ncbi:MAG: ChrR family anti-sigma-E factor [Sphingomonadales bacterium]